MVFWAGQPLFIATILSDQVTMAYISTSSRTFTHKSRQRASLCYIRTPASHNVSNKSENLLAYVVINC